MSEDLPTLDPELVALLDAERSSAGMPPEVAARLKARLAVSLGPGGGGSSGAPGPNGAGPSAPTPTGGLSLGAKLGFLGTFGLGLSIGIGLHASLGGADDVERPRVESQTPGIPAPNPSPPETAPVPLAPDEPSGELPAPSAPEPDTSAQRRAPLRPRRGSGSLDAERVLLERARTALARGEPRQALAVLATYGRRHPRGSLREEQEALAIQALVGAGEHAAAQQRGRRFLRRHRRSIFAPVVRSALASIDPVTAPSATDPTETPQGGGTIRPRWRGAE